MDLIVGKTYYHKMFGCQEVKLCAIFNSMVTYERTDKRWNVKTAYYQTDSPEQFATMTTADFYKYFCDDLVQYKIDQLKKEIKEQERYILKHQTILENIEKELHELQNKQVSKTS
jgi:hypothetical protein